MRELFGTQREVWDTRSALSNFFSLLVFRQAAWRKTTPVLANFDKLPLTTKRRLTRAVAQHGQRLQEKSARL